MWKDAALRCRRRKGASTGGVDGLHGFSTGVFFRVFFPQAVFHMSTNPVDFLFIAGIYISRNVFYDLCRLGKGFDHLFNALNGMQNSGVVPVIKFPADFF